MTFRLTPIGQVEKTESVIRIMIYPQFREGLVHLGEFSHAIILWWIHERDSTDDRQRLLANPPRGKGTEPSGVFACRSPFRPNPIGHSVAGLVSVDETKGVIVLDQIDAKDGTPVLDIKPYLPSSDKVDRATVAPWFKNLEKRYSG
jgi:tRNA-Thr(GGU) m(6)t(6)A37 methyltransferase TsaA